MAGDVMYLTCAAFLEAGLITGDCCGSCLSDLENDVAIHCIPCPANPDIEAEVCCHHVEIVKSLSVEAWESALRESRGEE